MLRRSRLAVVSAALLGLAGCQEDSAPAQPTPSLALGCFAAPSSGPAPLTVAFGLDVANATGALSYSIDYGDGTQGGDPNARHVYAAAGSYVASFTVAASRQTARCSASVTVTPAPAPSPTPRAANQPPVPDFRTNPPATGTSISGTAPFTVNFNLCRSVEPDGDVMYFTMDLDGNGTFEFHGASGADCRHSATYGVGTRTATVCVTDKACPSWPLCDDYEPLHPAQCRSYTVTAVP